MFHTTFSPGPGRQTHCQTSGTPPCYHPCHPGPGYSKMRFKQCSSTTIAAYMLWPPPTCLNNLTVSSYWKGREAALNLLVNGPRRKQLLQGLARYCMQALLHIGKCLQFNHHSYRTTRTNCLSYSVSDFQPRNMRC